MKALAARFPSKLAQRWDDWLLAVGAVVTHQQQLSDGHTTRRYYEVFDSRGGKWVVFLDAYSEERYSICIWAPDGMQIVPPAEPGWESLRASTRICQRCGRAADAVTRVGFAGRWCTSCADLHRSEVEYPGWTE